jgi:hypothetical protein
MEIIFNTEKGKKKRNISVIWMFSWYYMVGNNNEGVSLNAEINIG